MLTRKDKEWIRQMIREEFKEALYREVTIERNMEGGRLEKSNENLLDVLASWIPKTEGALRGMQEDTDKANNKMIEGSAGIRAVADILISMETGVNQFLQVAQALSGKLDESGLLPEPDDEGDS